MLDDRQLLRRFVEEGSEAAFGEIVSRHVNLVYSAAVRRTGGDAHAAQDVAQTVFTDLARKAGSLSRNVVLAGWLHQATRFAAAHWMRTERRRREREQTALAMNALKSETAPDWESIRPVLDEALDRLHAADRDALLLRFFEQRSFAEIGAALGAREEAARKRIGRALEKLRVHLSRRGVVTTPALLSATISAHAVQTAPAGLATTLAGAAVAGVTASAAAPLALFDMMTLTKVQLGVGALILAAATTPLVLQHQAQTRLRRENEHLRQQVEQLAAKPANNAPLGEAPAFEAQDRADLLRLRAEVTRLRGITNEMASLQADNNRLREAWSRRPVNFEGPAPDPDAERSKQAGIAKMNDSRILMLSFNMYANDHDNQFPTNLDMASPYLKSSALTGTNQFELVYFGSITNIRSPATTIVFRETQPWPAGGKWAKTYAFADGHSEVHSELDQNQLEAWERARVIPAPAVGE